MLLKKLTGLALTAILLAGCGQPQAQKEKPAFYLVNVLDDASFADAHIPGSIHIDFMKVKAAAQDWDRNTPIVTYCSNAFCSASKDAAKSLLDLGFKQVWAYEGGMAEWYQLSLADTNYKVEGPAKAPYLQQKVAPLAPATGPVKIISAQELQKMLSPARL
jgi:rhodanese-related sulfurtransferase